MRVLVVTAPAEAALYTCLKDENAPIRIYSDRWVEDDIIVKFGMKKKRERLCKKDYRRIRRAARQNDKEVAA